MIRREKVHADHNGRRHNGSYEVEDGKVIVSSAYGSKSAVLKPKDVPAAVAARLMLEIVSGWRP